jgi:hypothetical protein
MKKNYFKNLMQVSLLLGAAFVISSCDDVIGQEDNPVASYVQWQAKTPEEVTLKIGNTYTVKATAVSSAIIVYESENPEIAKVDPVTGEITAVAVGETNINAVVTGISTTGQSVFTPEKVSIKVIVKDGKVSLKAKAAEKVQTINTVDAAKTIDVSKFFDVYPETGNTITYTLKHHINNTGKKITGYADAGASLGSITAAGVYTQGTNTNDTTVYVFAEITTKAATYDWNLTDPTDITTKVNHIDTITINIKESIAYIGTDGKRKVLTKADDKYTTIDATWLSKAAAVQTLTAGYYYVPGNLDATAKNLKINGEVNLIIADGATLQTGYIQSDGVQTGTLNIFGQTAASGTLATANKSGNAIMDLAALNVYGVTVGAEGSAGVINNCVVINVNKGTLNVGKVTPSTYAIQMSTGGTITIENDGKLNAESVGAVSGNFAVKGDVTLTKGSFDARSEYLAVDGKLNAATGYEFLETDTPGTATSYKKITGTASTKKAVKGQAVPEE